MCQSTDENLVTWLADILLFRIANIDQSILWMRYTFKIQIARYAEPASERAHVDEAHRFCNANSLTVN